MTKELSRKTYAILMLIAGAVVALLGLALSASKNENIYDLPWFLVLIGALIIFSAIAQFKNAAKRGPIDLSKKGVKQIFMDNTLYIALVILIIIIAASNPRFMQFRVLRDISGQSASRIFIASGMSMLIISGCIDLSAGRQFGVGAVVAGSLAQHAEYGHRFYPNFPEFPVIVPILGALIVCMIIGLINGLLVSRLNILPFIATLATQIMCYGANCLYINSEPNNSQPLGGFQEGYLKLGQTMIGDAVPLIVVYAVVLLAIVFFILNYTSYGKNLYAIGGNKQAALVSGVNVKRTILITFVFASALYACAGIIESARTATATSNYGLNYESDAIAASVVGGISMSGGVGKVSGIIIGVLLFTIISYGLTFIGLDPNWQLVLKGVIIAATVGLDVAKNK